MHYFPREFINVSSANRNVDHVQVSVFMSLLSLWCSPYSLLQMIK